MSDEKPKSAYDALMEHAKHFGRFDAIEGHKHGKIATTRARAETEARSLLRNLSKLDFEEANEAGDRSNSLATPFHFGRGRWKPICAKSA